MEIKVGSLTTFFIPLVLLRLSEYNMFYRRRRIIEVYCGFEGKKIIIIGAGNVMNEWRR